LVKKTDCCRLAISISDISAFAQYLELVRLQNSILIACTPSRSQSGSMIVQTDAVVQQMISNVSNIQAMVSNTCMTSCSVACKPHCIDQCYLYHMHMQCIACKAVGKQPHIVKTPLCIGNWIHTLAACEGLPDIMLNAVLLLLTGRTCTLLTLYLPGRAHMHVECQYADIAEHTL